MLYYRLYFMSTLAGRIERFHEFEADTDEAAVAFALERQGMLAIELWQQSRKVARVESLNPGSQMLARRRVARGVTDENAVLDKPSAKSPRSA